MCIVSVDLSQWTVLKLLKYDDVINGKLAWRATASI